MIRSLTCLYVLIVFNSPLISQPIFRYAKNFFSNRDNNIRAMVADRNGFVYCLNEYYDTVDVDPGPAVLNFTTSNQASRYLIKLDPKGKLVWAKEFENSQSLYVTELHLSQQNYLYLTGWGDNQIDFDLGFGTENKSGGFYSPFVLKLDTAAQFHWLREFSGIMLFHALTSDNAGNVIFGGTMNTIADFDPGPSTYTLGTNNSFRSILVSLDSTGAFNWAKHVTLGGHDFCMDLTTDQSNDVYASGFYNGSILDNSGQHIDTANGSNGFVVKYSTGGTFLWGRKFASSYGVSGVRQLIVTRDKELYCGGNYEVDVDANPNSATETFTCGNTGYCQGCFVTKLDSNGNFIWAKNVLATRLKNFQTDYDKNLYMWADYYGGVRSPLISYNIAGVMNWSLTIPESLNLNEYGYRQLVVHDTSLYLAGTFDTSNDFDHSSNSFILSTKKNNVFLLRLSQKVNVMPPITTDIVQNKSESLLIWPNPSTRVVYLKVSSPGTTTVFDILGRQMCQFIIEGPGTQIVSLVQGVYLVEFVAKNTRITKKIIVE